MPFYEYQCGDCDHRLEVLQKISDEPLVFCPQCNEESLKKLISVAGFRLKGSGWYETDFKHNHKQKESAQKEKSSAGKSSDAKSESSGSSDRSSDKPSDKPSDKNGKSSQSDKGATAKDTPSKSTSSKEATSAAT